MADIFSFSLSFLSLSLPFTLSHSDLARKAASITVAFCSRTCQLHILHGLADLFDQLHLDSPLLCSLLLRRYSLGARLQALLLLLLHLPTVLQRSHESHVLSPPLSLLRFIIASLCHQFNRTKWRVAHADSAESRLDRATGRVYSMLRRFSVCIAGRRESAIFREDRGWLTTGIDKIDYFYYFLTDFRIKQAETSKPILICLKILLA